MDYREAGVDISAADAAKERIKRAGPRHLQRRACSPRSAPSAGCSGPTSRATRSPCSCPPRTASGTKIQVAIARRRARHRRLRPRRPLRERHPGAGRRAPLLPRLHRRSARMDADRVEAIVARLRARPAREFGCPLHRRRDGARCPAPTRRTTTTWPASSWAWWIASSALTGAGVRAGDVLLGLPSAGLHTNGYTLARKVLFDDAGPSASTRALPELGTTRGRGAAGPAPLATCAALEPLLERGQDPRPRPHHGRRLPRQHPARPARRPGRAHPRAAPGRCRRCSGSSSRAATCRDDEMFRTFNMGIGMVVVGRPRRPARRRALARAPRRDELRHRLRGRRARASRSSERVHGDGPRRRAHQRPRHPTCRPCIDAAARGRARAARSRS